MQKHRLVRRPISLSAEHRLEQHGLVCEIMAEAWRRAACDRLAMRWPFRRRRDEDRPSRRLVSSPESANCLRGRPGGRGNSRRVGVPFGHAGQQGRIEPDFARREWRLRSSATSCRKCRNRACMAPGCIGGPWVCINEALQTRRSCGGCDELPSRRQAGRVAFENRGIFHWHGDAPNVDLVTVS